MKNKKNILYILIGIFVFANYMLISGKAAGPMDGQIIDGSLLTSNESAFDEKPLIPENPFDGNINLSGTYLSNGISDITNKGGGLVYISGQTNCYRVSDKVQVYLYLERLSNGGWGTIKTHSNVAYNTYKVDAGMGFAVTKGYYYRVKGTHIAKKGSTTESCTTCTSAIYIG